MSVWGRARGFLKDLEPGEGYVPNAFEELERQCAERAQRDPAIHKPLTKEHIEFRVIYDNENGDNTECYMSVCYRERGQPFHKRGA